MTVNVSKPAINVREELADLRKPSGVAGEAMLRAETPQEQFNLIGAGRRNWIINGDFQVSQRGDYTSATAIQGSGVLYLDRWKTEEITVSGTIQQVVDGYATGSNSVKLAVTGSSSVGRLGVYQIIEDYKKLAGREVTVSCKLKATAPNCYLWVYDGSSYTKIAEHSGNSSWESLSGTINVSSSASQLRVYVKYSSSVGNSDTPNALTSSDYFEIAQVQLELGKVATPFEHRSYGEELALCQRYYQIEGYGQYQRYGTGFAYSTIGASVVINLPTAMRTRPAITTSGANTLLLNYGADTLNTLSTIAINSLGSSERTVTITAQVASGLTVGQAVLLISNNNTNAFIDFDAEL